MASPNLFDKVTLNCDMGEGFGLYKLGDDDSLLKIIDVANVACGFHAGDYSVMAETVKKAQRASVKVGAHPSFPDLQGFGRREMHLSAEEVKHSVMYQVGALKAFLDVNNMTLSHIKPHGSLYGVSARDRDICSAIVDVCCLYDLPLMGMPGTYHESVAEAKCVPFLAEFFADLEYDDNGNLIITRTHEHLAPEVCAKRVRDALGGRFRSINGKQFDVAPKSICVHSDSTGAVAIASAVRREIDAFNVLGCRTESINKLLIANRGEIACRIIKTCKQMGIKTVAIYELPDENSMHALEADESVVLPEGKTYTSIDAIIAICQQTKVDAVHPGYGFLSENPLFCKEVERIGVVFLGPTSSSISQFGLKHKARELALEAGVPVVPGTDLLASMDEAVLQGTKVSYPVLLKATGGGGGIGMMICHNEQELRTAYFDCQIAAEKYFGNSGVYIEKYYQSSRHIEVQIFGDGSGMVVHLGERECSVQRRHQKVIEETPSPFMLDKPNLRQSICDAAIRLAKLVNYRSAGTVEFLVVDEGENSSETGQYFFLEMNTRLQVEHGVTELTNSVDLVEWMILLGDKKSKRLCLDRFQWRPQGHALEVRVYAENPSLNFQPSPGLLTKVSWPHNVRVDTWVKSGTRITTGYDPLLAKIMAYGSNREDASRLLLDGLSGTTIAGPITNLDYLISTMEHDDFQAGRTTTQLLTHIKHQPCAIRVIQGGPDTTVQDWPGRMALRVYGIQPNGPMDDIAFRVANLLVGNEPGVSALEMTLQGPKLFFYVSRFVAVTGADMEIVLSIPDQERKIMTNWSSFHIPAGGTLSIGKVCRDSAGCRSYLAISGGLDVPEYLGSKSTFAAFGYGGFQGRILQANDMLPLSKTNRNAEHDISKREVWLPEILKPRYTRSWVIRCMPGPHADPDYVTKAGMNEIFATDWEVHYNSAKMGVRLKGPTPEWARVDGGDGGSHPSNIHDVGYALGGINFTGNSPVILTLDGPTQGGFTCPLTVLSSEMWKTGQLSPGDLVRFSPVCIDQALEIRKSKEAYFTNISQLCTFPDLPVPLSEHLCIADPSCSAGTLHGYNHQVRAILDQIPNCPETGRPFVQYRQGGDCYVLVEYGDPKGSVDLNIFARVRVLQQTLRLQTDPKTLKVLNPLIPGTIDSAPSIRSLLIRYDAMVLPQITLVAYLKKLETELPDIRQVVFPSRHIHMPLAFDDRWSQEAMDQYRRTIRAEACYLPSNVEFIAENNGMKDGRTDVLKHLVGSPLLTLGVGFFLGCPFLCPINPLDRLKVPKYNPSRVFTPSGAVGIGGSLIAIYPLESPGGYQLFGRTIPTWDTFGSVQPFTPHQPWLLNLFDKVTFYQVTEEELLHHRRLALAGKYKYDISHATFDMAEYNKLEQSVAEERRMRDVMHRTASAKLKAQEDRLLEQQATCPVDFAPENVKSLQEGQQVCKALLAGVVKDIRVKPGDNVNVDETVVMVLEAMKTEIEITADTSGLVEEILVSQGQQVTATDDVCIVRISKS